ncbi:MAG TPA: serine hydrolase [Aggregatilineales bacterium]|nr:serine hydrolase [Aggregatilineales bacterium]
MLANGFGRARRRSGLPILALFSGVLLLAALVAFALELSRFASNRDLLQVDITVAGVPVTGLKLSEAVNTWEAVYNQPVELDFQGSPILLSPADIGFNINSQLMLSDVQSKVTGTNNYWADFWNYLWRRPTNPVSVDLRADYQEAKLRNFMQDIANRYEQRASGATFDGKSMTFDQGAAGTRLDIEKSIQDIDTALRKPTDRKVKLTMKSEGPHTATMATLKQAILDYFTTKGFLPDGQNSVASLMLIDLQNGQEININPDVPYSAESTIKVPIMLNIFRKLTFAIDNDTRWLMAASILCSSNSASNFLMQLAGTGADSGTQLASGIQQVNNTVGALGAANTFISAPLYVGDKKYQFSVPAPKTSPDKTFDTQPDPYSQTTADDMAILLQEIYDCSEYASGLVAIMPDNYNQTKCKEMVELLSGNIIGRMIELGVPSGTRVAHKNGWGAVGTGYNSSDAAIVYTPGGNYILVMYMWERLQPGQTVGSILPWETMEGISRIVYNYFNPGQALMVSRVPENQYTAVDCVMPNPAHEERIDLTNISSGRFDANGHVLPDACYNYPQCDPIPVQKLGGQTDQATPGNQSSVQSTPNRPTPTLAPQTTNSTAKATQAASLPPPPPK